MPDAVSRFSGVADQYDAVRPQPPADLVTVIAQWAGAARPDVVDLGAGTGLSAVIWAGHARQVTAVEPSAAGPLGIEPIIAHIHSLEDIERAVAVAAAQPNGGMFVPLDVTIITFMHETIATIARHRLPAIYSERVFVTSGGLVSYGADRMEQYRGGASYVDRILRGEKAGDLPFQQPTKYELVINLKIAKALSLTIPPNLLFTADEVIE